MKKILLSLLILAASLNVMATDFAVATLTLKGNTSLEQGEVTLVKTDDPVASSYCAPLYINQYHVVMYALNGSEKYQIWANADLTNFPLGIQTYSDASYTITVSNVSGSETLTLYDAVENQTIALTAGQTYDFTAAANSTIEDRFIINYVAPSYVTSVTTNDYGWATFSYDQDLVPVNATAQTLYKGAINGEYLDLDDVDYVKAGEGVLVYGTPNTIYNFAAGSGSDDFTGNALKATATYETSMQNVYVLKGNAFLEYVGTNALAANKAFIQLPSAGPNNAPKRITMRFNGATDVENVQGDNVQCTKVIENGQIYILHNGAKYNVQGQIVQ